MSFPTSLDPIVLALIVLSVVSLILLCLVIWLTVKMRRFLIGVDAKNVSESLTYVSVGLKDLQQFRDELEVYLASAEKRLRKSVQSVHTVRFNPFKGAGGGGNQSFATAFLNEEGDGVIVSSLYARDHVSIFAKPVKNNLSEHELSDEEKVAINEAIKKLKIAE